MALLTFPIVLLSFFSLLVSKKLLFVESFSEMKMDGGGAGGGRQNMVRKARRWREGGS